MLSRRALMTMAMAALALPQVAAGQATPQEETTAMRIRFAFADTAFTVTLADNPTARDLVTLLPLDLAITDYSTNEKIAHLPRKLTEVGSGPFSAEAPGDLCYYAPWGNLAFFHAPYRWSRGLIRLGRIEGGIAPLLIRGDYRLHATAQP